MTEWGNVLSADEVDPLAGLRFKFGETKNLPMAASELISDNETHGMRKETPNEETYSKYGGATRKIEIEAIERHGAFIRIPFGHIPKGASLIEGRFAYAIKINSFRRDMRKPMLISTKTENSKRDFA